MQADAFTAPARSRARPPRAPQERRRGPTHQRGSRSTSAPAEVRVARGSISSHRTLCEALVDEPCLTRPIVRTKPRVLRGRGWRSRPVLLHDGFAESVQDLREWLMADALTSEGLRVIFADHRGHGRSRNVAAPIGCVMAASSRSGVPRRWTQMMATHSPTSPAAATPNRGRRFLRRRKPLMTGRPHAQRSGGRNHISRWTRRPDIFVAAADRGDAGGFVRRHAASGGARVCASKPRRDGGAHGLSDRLPARNARRMFG